REQRLTSGIHVDCQDSRSITDAEARKGPSLWRFGSILEPPRDRMGLVGIQPAECSKRNLLAVTELDASSAGAGFHHALGKRPHAREVYSAWRNNQCSGSPIVLPDRSVLRLWGCRGCQFRGSGGSAVAVLRRLQWNCEPGERQASE